MSSGDSCNPCINLGIDSACERTPPNLAFESSEYISSDQREDSTVAPSRFCSGRVCKILARTTCILDSIELYQSGPSTNRGKTHRSLSNSAP